MKPPASAGRVGVNNGARGVRGRYAPRGIHNDDATRPCSVCSGKKGCSHRRSNKAPGFSRAGGRQLWSAGRRETVSAQGVLTMTTRRRNIAPDDAMRPCAVCSGKKGCSHRRSNEAPGFSRAGGRQLWSAMRRGTVCAQGNPQRRRHASVFGMQWKKGCSHRRSNEAPGFSPQYTRDLIFALDLSV